MRSLKKLITIVLALAMALTCVSIPAMADFSDITNEKVATAVDKLVAYKIITGYEDGTFRPDNQITRAEFAAIVTRMKGVADNLPADSVTGFSDLDNDASRSWARPYVKAAVDLKIINGFEDGTFRAGEPVTYEQAVKMLVCAVGYEVVAQSEYNKILVSNPNATWSAGYIAAANKHGVTNGVITAQISQPASRGVVAVLTSNALEVPELVVDENGNLTKPEEGEEETEINMQTINGIIIGTHFTGVDTANLGLAENEIRIDAADDNDDGDYTLSDELIEKIDLDEYIGRRVDAYYDNIEGRITDMKLKSTSSDVIEEALIESIDGYSIRYRNSKGRTSTQDLSTYAFIVNGKYVDSYDIEENFKNGTIEYFTTGQHKIAKVSSYNVFVVHRYDKENEKIYLKYENYNGNNYYPFPRRASDKPVIYVKNTASGSYIKTDFDALNLSQYDIINYLESPSGTAGDAVRKMYVTKIANAKSGKVTATLEGEREVEIGNETYYLTQQYYNFDGDSNDEKAPFELSDSYTCYFDYTGQIAAVKYSTTDSTSWSYGYIYDVDTREEQIGIYTSSGVADIFTLKSGVKVNGSKGDADDVFTALEEAAAVIEGNNIGGASNTTYAQPIKYSASGKKIDAIDTILLNGDEEIISKYDDQETLNGSNDNFTYDGVSDGESASTSTTKVTVDGTNYGINSSTIIIYVPDDREDDSAYAVLKASTAFAVTDDRYTEVFAMDTTTSKARLVLVYGTNPTLNFIGTSPYMLVTKARNVGDTEEFTGYVRGSASTSSVKVSEDKFETSISDVSGSQVEVGDIIRYITDINGEIIAIKMIYDASEEGKLLVGANTDFYKNEAGTGSDFVACYGVVSQKDTVDKTIEIESDITRSYKTGSAKVFRLASNGDVETGAIEDVLLESDGGEASTVVLISHAYSSSENTNAAVIYIVE